MPRSKISSPSGSRSSDALLSSDMSSSSTYSCVVPDVIEGSSAGDIFKPDRGDLFVRAYSLLHLWSDLLEMVTVSSSLPCDRA